MERVNSYVVDITLFTFMCGAPVNFSIWGIIIPYYYSYSKHYHETRTVKEVFGATLFIFVGLSFASIIMPRILYILGLKKALVLGSIMYALNNTMMYAFTGIVSIYLTAVVNGMVYRYFQLLTILYFTEKHPTIATKCYGIANNGTAFSALILSYVCTLYINPGNRNMEERSTINGYEEPYFSTDISFRFPGFMNIQSIYGVIVVLGLVQFISDPEKYKSHYKGLKSLLTPIDQDSRIQIAETYDSIHRSVSFMRLKQNKSFFEGSKSAFRSKLLEAIELKDKEDNNLNSFASDSIRETSFHVITFHSEVRTVSFWLIFITTVARISMPNYLIDNFKVLGYLVTTNDKFLTLFFSISSFTGILGGAVAAIIYERIGMINTFILSLAVSVITDFTNATIGQSSTFIFIVAFVLMRASFSFSMQVSNIVIFSLYGPSLGLSLSKIFDISAPIAMVVMVVFNGIFLTVSSFRNVFWAYLVFDGIALLLIFKLKRLMPR